MVWVYLDYRVSSGPFLRFSMRFEFLSEMFEAMSLTLKSCCGGGGGGGGAFG